MIYVLVHPCLRISYDVLVVVGDLLLCSKDAPKHCLGVDDNTERLDIHAPEYTCDRLRKRKMKTAQMEEYWTIRCKQDSMSVHNNTNTR